MLHDGLHSHTGQNAFSFLNGRAREGLTVFDFGRSRAGSGPAAFKHHMGFEPTPLDYQFFFPHGGHPPRINPDNPRMALPRRMLAGIPTWMARLVGPTIMRNVP